MTKRSTGLDEPDILVGGESAETMTYSIRGLPSSVGSSYGTLLPQLRFDASGRLTKEEYGDAAGTVLERGYDGRGRNHRFRVQRPSAPSVWSTSTATYSTPDGDTTQLELMNLELTHDRVGNPLTMTDFAGSVWRDGARPLSRSFAYDPAYRVKQVDFAHTGGVDPFVSAYRPEALAGDRTPVAERDGVDRIQQQRFHYDPHGNVEASDDNEYLTFDRSFGEQHNGWTAAAPLPAGTGGPNQFLEGSTADAPTTAAYDLAGNMTELTVSRATCSGIMPDCTHRFRYEWDEVGQLLQARRWDFPAGELPAYDAGATPTWKLEYAHGFGGRALTSKTDDQGATRHTLDIFDTMRAASVTYNGTEYRIRDKEEIGFIGGVGRIFVDREGFVPQAGPTPIHVYFTIGDQLGSAAFVIDKDSGEVVERTANQSFGKIESDYRPDRWGNNREDFKFTGKEEDIEVGATYFGARFYSPHIGRWMSADPLTIHDFGADPNPYAYVSGRVSSYIDPFGLAQGPATPTTGADGTIYMPDDPLPVERPRPHRSVDDTTRRVKEAREQRGEGAARAPRNLNDVIDRGLGIPVNNKGDYVSVGSVPREVWNDSVQAGKTAFWGVDPVGQAYRTATGGPHPLDPLIIATPEGDQTGLAMTGVSTFAGGGGGPGSSGILRVGMGVARRVAFRLSARRLGTALEKAGFTRPIGAHAAHHIVGADKRADPARRILQKFDIGLNDAENGTFLAQKVHAGLHTDAYYEGVNAALARATTKAQAVKILDSIGRDLRALKP